jgi:alanine dehydrogenase
VIVGVPRETKPHEYRVALRPVGVELLRAHGHQVLIEHGAGEGSGYLDAEYAAAGAELVHAAETLWARADMVVKVKEPQSPELAWLRSGQVVFTYFHFAADRALTLACLERGITAVAYETLEVVHAGRPTLPLLTPMSEIAGRMSVQEGAKCLERPQEGRGILLGGVPGVEPGNVLILGAGVVGSQAARMAAGLGANVTVLDLDVERLRYLSDVMPANVTGLYSDPQAIRENLALADLVIGAVLIPGALAPRLIRRGDLKTMKQGSVIVDVSVDQGGCTETTRPTTHGAPTYVVDGVVHYCVTNMPGAVGRTSTQALTNATLPWVVRLADEGVEKLSAGLPGFRKAVNMSGGKLLNAAVAAAHGLEVG